MPVTARFPRRWRQSVCVNKYKFWTFSAIWDAMTLVWRHCNAYPVVGQVRLLHGSLLREHSPPADVVLPHRHNEVGVHRVKIRITHHINAQLRTGKTQSIVRSAKLPSVTLNSRESITGFLCTGNFVSQRVDNAKFLFCFNCAHKQSVDVTNISYCQSVLRMGYYIARCPKQWVVRGVSEILGPPVWSCHPVHEAIRS